MAILVKRRQLAAKIESNEGTAETPGTGDVLLVFEPAPDFEQEMYSRDPARTTLDQLESLAGMRSGKMTFICEMVGSGTRGTAPDWGKLLKACGFAESIDPDTSTGSVEYIVASASIPSVTIDMYLDGIKKRIWGARGNVRPVLEAGKPGLLHFEFTGMDWEVSDADMLSGVSYNATKPPVCLGANFEVDSYAAKISKLEINLGNDVILDDQLGQSSGHGPALIVNRNPRVTFDAAAIKTATKDFFGIWRANTAVALAATLGSDAGNIIALSCPKLRLESVKAGNRKGITTWDVEALAAMNTGDDSFKIVIT